ncbi:Pentatricopeptide repeat [Lasallia pustulata]|uniref:Pentatricopeptide repeat n=1 Tax=Lasallia pustulata TaxID=136370 RepID=A0A1W5DBM5_9LECA|nr:Pentatricopeptide repeat [Lasallia pustulata]
MHSTAAAAEQGQEPPSSAPIRPPRPNGINQWGEHKEVNHWGEHKKVNHWGEHKEVNQWGEHKEVNQWGAQKANAMAKRQQFERRHLKRELPFLRDPLKLADHILGLLRQDEEKKALEMVRLASRRKAAFTVSWNHLVDYEMSKGRVSNAVKIYNEMKKRAQPPDSHTYTIIFRGLATYKDHEHSLLRALSIYNSMFAPNSPVKPSITHSNAVLKVCARRLDMDALYGIAAKLPTHGAGAPDNLTFTTILNAVRHAAWTFDGRRIGETPEETAARRRRAVMEGRRIWDDVIKRWRKGDIWIDEELVCAMGRLLLISRHPQDLDDVLSLVEQTMAIPRAIPRLNAPERSSVAPVPARLFSNSSQRPLTDNEPGRDKSAMGEGEQEEWLEEAEVERLEEEAEGEELEGSEEREDDVQIRQTDQPHQAPQLDEASESSGANHIVYGPSISPVLSDSEFAPVDISHAKAFDPRTRTTQPLAYVRPGNNTLSLLMDACIGMRAAAAAQDYWGILTGEVQDGGHGVSPDAENYFMYLRLLRLKRSSRLAVELVEEKLGSADAHFDKSRTLVLGPMSSRHGNELAVPKTFRIAMSACVRDNANPRVLDSATRLLRLMQARLPEPDLKTLAMYLDVAAGAGVRSEVPRGGVVAWKRLLGATEVAEGSLQNMRSLLSFGYGEVALEQAEREWRRKEEMPGEVQAVAVAGDNDDDNARRLGDLHEDRPLVGEELGGFLRKAAKPRQDRVPDKDRGKAVELARRMGQGEVYAHEVYVGGVYLEMEYAGEGEEAGS